MLITDLQHLELVVQPSEIQGGQLPIDAKDAKLLIGKSVSAFAFNALAVGAYGSLASGIPEILTTAVPGNFSVGFKFQYTSVAIGIPFERA